MAIIEVQCSCGKKAGVPDEYAGKTIRCPACKQPLLVLATNPDPPADDVDEDLVAMVRRAAPKPPPSPPAPVATLPPTPTPKPVPPEPWYYEFLTVMAWLGMVGGVLASLLVMLAGFNHGTSEGPGDLWSGGRDAVAVGLMVTGGLSLIGVLMVSAAALLAVDVARNVRATRYK